MSVNIVTIPTLTINDVSVAEGNSGTTNFTFTVTRSHDMTALSVNFQTADGSATVAGSDYQAQMNTLNFVAFGSLTQMVTILVNGDVVVEGNETFFVNLSNPVNASIVDGQGMGTIQNDDMASISINDPAGVNEATGTVTFTVSLTGTVQGGFTVDYMTADGTATAGDNDYAAIGNGQVVFAGTMNETQPIQVTLNDDAKVELDETFLVNLMAPGGGFPAGVTILDGQGIGTILTDDQAGISINNVTMDEGDAGTTQFTFTVTLDAPVDVQVDVPFTTQDVSATAPSDYLTASGTLQFPVGAANQTLDIVVDVNGDTTVEPTETFHVALTGINASGREMNGNIIITQQPGVGTIVNDDNASLSINDRMFDESAGVFQFTVTLSGAVAGGLTVDFATNDGTATVGDNDYNATNGQLIFAGTAGETMPINVTVNDDAKVELNETFSVDLSNLQAGGLSVTIADGQGIGTIQNDDAATISINNVTANEGAGGATTNFVFNVTMTTVVDTPVTVDFGTADGSATTGDSDYVANAGMVSFAVGNTGPQTITVTVNNDVKVELNETFDVNLSNIIAGGRDVTFLDNQGVGTIVNDDQARIIIGDVSQNEGNAGPTNFAFTATLLDNVDAMVMVDFTTSDSTATVGDGDYAAANGTITFNGVAGNPQIINVSVTGDTKVELTESFVVQLANIQAGGRNVVFTDNVAVGTIINDDSAGLSINDVSVNEGASGATPLLTFTVTLSADLFAPLSVDFATADGTATAGSDYTANNGTLNFTGTAGEQLTIDVVVTGDDTVENNETLFVNLSNIVAGGQNVSFTKQQGNGTITNDDAATLSINDVSMAEGAGPFQYTVTLSAAVAGGITVDFATADGTATTADNDYNATSGQLVFAGTAGEQMPINVTVNGDTKVELNETFSVTLAQAAGISVTVDPSGAGTIQNDDSATVSIGDVTMAEGAGGATTSFVFNATLSAAVDVPVSVDFTTADGTALTGDSDYGANSGTVNFVGNAGEVQTVTVTVNDDAKVEVDETFNVNLSNIQATGRNVLAGDLQGLGTIVNDDAATITIGDVSQNEGSGGGTTTFSFAVTLDAQLGSAVTVDFATANGTATTADNDYTAANGTLNFNGTAGEVQTVDISVTADNKVEPTEAFFVNLSNLQAGGLDVTLADLQGLGTIVTDDGATISINDVSVNEGPQGTPTSLQFTVTLSAAVASAVSVDFATANMTATVADGDYTQTNGTLNFVGNAGETQLINVPVNGDNKVELDETLAVNLSNLQAGGLMVAFADQQGVGTIVNDDGMASISISDVTQQEGSGGGTTTFNFTVTLDKQVGGAISVAYATADGTATTADGDYTPANNTLNFIGNAGEQLVIPITVAADDVAELDEVFFVNLSNLQAGGLPVVFANQQGIGTILNDDDIGACGEPNNLVIDGRAFSGMETVVACQTLTIGPNVQILGSANVIFRAGESVILANGVSVQAGAVLAIELDPTLAVP
ncbi:MAG TPA: Calx-beta domain-containing protein [Vicinamibacteria bacterium]|nr:Calx-beta domain-containing protein [Vicinamibacteria bacterium]